MSRQKFSKGLKRQIAIEYMQSGKSRQEIALKYGLPNVTTLSSWVNTYLTPFEILDKCVSLPPANQSSEEIMSKREEEPVTDQSALIAALQKQIQKLEADLKKSQDKNLARQPIPAVRQANEPTHMKGRGITPWPSFFMINANQP